MWADGQKDRLTDVTKLIDAFPDLKNAPKIANMASRDRNRLIKHGRA